MSTAQTLLELQALRYLQKIDKYTYWEAVKRQSLNVLEISKILQAGTTLQIEKDTTILHQRLADGSIVSLNFDPDDLRGVTLSVVADGPYEASLSELLLSLTKNARSFIDVGANAGFYAIAAAVSNPMLKVFAFEPNSAVRNKLTLNVDLNGVGSRVSISPYGMSNSKSTANIFVPRVTGSGGGSLINLHPDEEVDYTELIELSTLDEEVTENPDLLKIDVEGHELKVILGGLRSLEESLPTVFIELLLKWMAPFGDHPMDVMKVMATFGYSCWAMSDTFVRPITVIDESTVETNFVFAHPSRPSHISAIESLLS